MRMLIAPLVFSTITLMAIAVEPSQRRDLQLFLLIGQSNMAGRGVIEPQDKVPHPRVFVLTKDLAWAPAVDPLHYDKPERTGVGLGSSFGRSVADDQPRVAVGLIPAAFGGTTLDEWRPGGALYSEAIKRTRVAMMNGTLVGILWHQGEEDVAPELTATYPERFAAMIERLRSDLGAKDVPVIVGELGRFVENSSAMNKALGEIPANVPRSACVSSERLTDKGDKLHFDSAALREFGRRYAEAWKTMWARNAQ